MTQHSKTTTSSEEDKTTTIESGEQKSKQPQTQQTQPSHQSQSEQSTYQQAQKEQQPKSSYPANDTHNNVFGSMGVGYEDSPMGRAWARMFDKGVYLGPAVTSPITTEDGEMEIQYFTSGRGVRSLSDGNINQTVVFSDARGELGEESGI